MFGKSNNTLGVEVASFNKIGTGTSIVGDITSNGDIRIEGTLKGNLTISGKLVVGATGKIEGNINCQNADVEGDVHGNIIVSELLALKATAKILGDIVTGKISIEPNATFTGTCNMGAVVKNMTKDVRERAAETA